jgi:hypothetical protein
MTFGQVKSIIEKNLIESYRNEKEFKKSLREFKENVLNSKSLSKVYNLYDQLSTSQGLSSSDANEFLNEGIGLIQKLLPNIKMPKSVSESNENLYSDIDTLVYTNKLNIHERLQSRKNLIKVLMSENKIVKESIQIPISTMVKIANQTLENYVDTMDEQSKKTFIEILKSDGDSLKEDFSVLKEKTIEKLNSILGEQKESDVIEKISETIDKLKGEEFNQINYFKLVNLEKNL